MGDRIIGCICPYCKKATDVYIIVGQTYNDKCQWCNRIIHFDESGTIFKNKIK